MNFGPLLIPKGSRIYMGCGSLHFGQTNSRREEGIFTRQAVILRCIGQPLPDFHPWNLAGSWPELFFPLKTEPAGVLWTEAKLSALLVLPTCFFAPLAGKKRGSAASDWHKDIVWTSCSSQ